ncbi:Glycogen recognition site of AMP-activated protein kinase [Fodinibius roseus]|uniref:Glycogen recognition site of AMP-activated protein kinase n=1 Tax=Fodinibius roseus TaxID=1194090 RepID=A0A1M4TRM8_9BACT|nr:glycogen-binding domain-containing protein [Fodinibius roseus]SHE47068.1 Glycogen recognition site of AMP-activated protein kinase [Fodinibius roseus]
MKQLPFIICLLFLTTPSGFGQHGQTVLSLDSRVGYSTNSYLNPFLGEWDSTVETGYNFTSLLGRSFWYGSGHSFSLSGGVIYEPFFDKQLSTWKGGIGLVDYNYRLTNNVSIGVEGGSSYMQSQYNRTFAWVQPKFTWFLTPFTLLRTKLGSNFRRYRNYGEVDELSDRLDLYSLEFETWPTYRWRLTAGIYGGMDTLPDIQEGFTTQTSAGYYFRNGASITLTGYLQQYQFQQAITESNGGTNAIPPGGGGSATGTADHTNRILRVGLESALPVSKRLALFADIGAMRFLDNAVEESTSDFNVSGGIRFSIEPKLNSGAPAITPEWEKEGEHQEIHISFSGEGRLYLVGSFNNWNKEGIPLTEQSENTFTTQLSLEMGAYEYKVLRVRGDSEEWLEFSNEVYTVSDGFDNENAMILVE